MHALHQFTRLQSRFVHRIWTLQSQDISLGPDKKPGEIDALLSNVTLLIADLVHLGYRVGYRPLYLLVCLQSALDVKLNSRQIFSHYIFLCNRCNILNDFLHIFKNHIGREHPADCHCLFHVWLNLKFTGRCSNAKIIHPWKLQLIEVTHMKPLTRVSLL